MPAAAQLADPSPEAGCHVSVTLKDYLARLEVHILPCGGWFLPKAAVIEKALLLSAFSICEMYTEFAVDRILVDDLALRAAV